MKRISYIFISTIALLTACNNTPDSFTLNKTIVELYTDSTMRLTPKEDFNTKNLIWESSNEDVATVDANGLITAHNKGQATITASIDQAEAASVVIVKGVNALALPTCIKSKKRGVSFHYSLIEDVALLDPAVSWSYNWGHSPTDQIQSEFNVFQHEFIPMVWSPSTFDAERIRTYKQENPSCEYILAYNEPNLTDQCNMTPTQAAAHWPKLKALADELNLKIVSPAMNYGTLENYYDPTVWLDEFFTLIPLDDIDAISIHCYMSSPSAVQSYINRFRKYNKPIWMTEFCAWEGQLTSPVQQMHYMSDIINYMEHDPMIERYAWFIPRASESVETFPYMQLLTKIPPFDLTDLGRVFEGIPSGEKAVLHNSKQHILAQAYSDICTSESIEEERFINGPHLRPSTDTEGNLELYNFFGYQWVEYQVDFKEATDRLHLRYAAMMSSECEVRIDGESVCNIIFSNTGSDTQWETLETIAKIPAGRHTVRLEMKRGAIALNWIKFE